MYGVYRHKTIVLLTIHTDDSRPIYEQVADGVRQLIARGELGEGAALPPVRQLAADLGVNLNTIATAYKELQREGLIEIRHGSGARVTSRTAAEKPARELEAPLRSALTGLVLAGWGKRKILDTVARELKLLEGES